MLKLLHQIFSAPLDCELLLTRKFGHVPPLHVGHQAPKVVQRDGDINC